MVARAEQQFERFEQRRDGRNPKPDPTDPLEALAGLRDELHKTRRWLVFMWLTGLLGLAAIFVEIALRT